MQVLKYTRWRTAKPTSIHQKSGEYNYFISNYK